MASDWLGIGLQQRSHTRQEKTGNPRIEEYLISKYGRLQIIQPDVIKTILNLYDVVLFGGANL
jgi:hypothetical protein